MRTKAFHFELTVAIPDDQASRFLTPRFAEAMSATARTYLRGANLHEAALVIVEHKPESSYNPAPESIEL